MIPKEFQEAPFSTAFDIATQITWSQDELEVYDYVMIKEMEEVSALNTAIKKGFNQGMEEGIEKGIEKGMEKGIEKGMEKGMEKGIKKGKELGKEEGLKEGKELGAQQKAIEIAKNLLDVLDNKTIFLKTGLSVEEIEKLR